MKTWENEAFSKDEYRVAKRASRQVVFAEKKAAEEKQFVCINKRDARVFKIAKQMKKGNQDVVGERCILDGNEYYLEKIS